MCEIKILLTVAALLLAVTGFCIYQVNPKVGHQSEIKNESPCQKEHKKVMFERWRMLSSS